MAADRDADVPGVPWRVAKRYVHTLGRGRLLAAHTSLLESGLASPFGEQDVATVDDLPFGTDDELVTTEVDVLPWLADKRAALAAYRSQIGPDSFFFNTPDDLSGAVFGTEQFVLEEGRPGGPGIETDLFAGLLDGNGDGVTPDAFRTVLGHFATGVAIMTSMADDHPHGMTANAVTSVSLDPPLVLVCVDRTAVMAGVVEKAGAFALSFLSDDQEEVSQWFADPTRPDGGDQFDGVATLTATTGSPILEGSHAWVDCRRWATYDGGDHVIVVGEVVALGHPDTPVDGPTTSPLLYHQGRYARLATDA
jgi:flavin reductase (DIM6/NTAB) family NADH-FMN oxidoreductase RutF